MQRSQHNSLFAPLNAQHIQLSWAKERWAKHEQTKHTHSNACHAGFVVSASYIGSNANQIGMNLSSWENCYHCGSTPGTCTAVQGGSPYDQFSTFRSSSLAGVLANAGSNCSWISNSVMTFGSAQYPVQLVACDYPAGLLNVTLQLNASAFGVLPTLPTLSLVNSGQFAWVPGSLTGTWIPENMQSQ